MQKINHQIKPFLKWAGGKGQLLEKFYDFYPGEIKSGKIKYYFEPFLGGGAVFLHIMQQFEISAATVYDINKDLVLTWKTVQQKVDELIAILDSVQKKYQSLSSEKRKEFYYSTREQFNINSKKINYSKLETTSVKHAADIIFLNKTCFNGLFRFNAKGEFNVPIGSYKNPKILDAENLHLVSGLIGNITIKNTDFKEVEKDILPNSFVYFDPPYRPLSTTSSFTSYHSSSFNDDNQKELADLFQRLNEKGVRLMLSNSDPKNTNPDDSFFDDLYSEFNIQRILAKRAINSNAGKRNEITEILVTNYQVK